ncbi:MAG: MFS transporter [Myxococcota bacterium]
MSAPLSKLVDLRSDERGLVAQISLVLFGLIAAHTMLETARDALFLGKLPPSKLTWVYALLAVVTLGAASVNNRFVRVFGCRNALICSLHFSAYGTVLFYLLPKSPTLVFGFYVWSALLGTVLVVQFWTFAGHVFTVTQGKRLFGLIAAGGVLGAVIGASISIAVLEMAPVSLLMVLGSTIFLATAVLLTFLEPDAPEPLRAKRRRGGWRGGIEALRGRPYLVRLGVLTALATVTVLVTDYLFKSVAAATFEAEDLGGFFARYYAALNAVALAVQVFVSGYLVRRTGTILAFIILPLLLVLGASGILLAGGVLLAVLATKGADGALRHSLHRISLELLWMPVPDEERSASKNLVDAVVVRGSQAVAAGALFMLGLWGLDEPRILAGVVVALGVLWVVVGLGLRKPYIELFRNAVHRDGPDASSRLQLDLRSVEVVVEALSSRDPARVIAAMELLASNGRNRLIPGLILYHESEEVLMRALELIAEPERKDWIPLAERLCTHSNEAVRVEALKAMARAGVTDPLESRLLDVSPSVRGQAAFWLAQMREGRPDHHEAIKQIVEIPGEAGASAVVGILEAVRDSGDARWAEFIAERTQDESDRVLEAAISAMVTVRDARFIPVLVEELEHHERRPIIRDALVALGAPAQAALERALSDHTLPLHLRTHVPRSLSKFRNQRAADVLLDTIMTDHSGQVRYKSLRGLGRLVADTEVRVSLDKVERRTQVELTEYLRILSFWVPLQATMAQLEVGHKASAELLLSLLEDKQNQALERAFRLLQIVHPRESIQGVSEALRSGDRRVRAQAQEYIDALTLASGLTEVRSMLRIISDDLPSEERVRRASQYLDSPPSDAGEALRALIRESDESVAGLAAYHALNLGEEALKEDVVTVSQERSLGGSLKSFIELMAAREEPTGVI